MVKIGQESKAWTNQAKTAILSTLTEKLISGKRLYFDELHRSLNFVGLTEPRPEGGLRIHLLTASQLKSNFSQTYLKMQLEDNDPKAKAAWTEEDRALWQNVRLLQDKLKAKTPTQLFNKVGKKLFASEQEFYKSFPPETSIQFFEKPYIDLDF